ncbi:MAG: endonuclease/exonuclease/phosphatase family protein [Spirochaetales bacterium]|nr:endonuclease/exonuclease/phosphatase family protein [Spirochaetales bacterium]
MNTKKIPRQDKVLKSGLWPALLLVAALLMSCVMPKAQNELLVMSYNVQNLFDDRLDGTEYREYDPGKGHWTGEDYQAKLEALVRVLRSVSTQEPDILALQEVENSRALIDLLKTGGFNYPWKVMVPAPASAVNTALLSRLPVKRVHVHHLSLFDGQAVRPVVEVEIQAGQGLLVVFVNHWKSKSGGQELTEPSRMEAAAIITRRLAYWQGADPLADILVLGDFNEQGFDRFPDDVSFHQAILHETSLFAAKDGFQGLLTTGCLGSPLFQIQQSLFDPYYEAPEKNPGSYVFRGQWLAYDKILMNQGLFNNQGLSYIKDSFHVHKNEFLLSQKGFPLGWRNSSASGFSDHLPVIARFYLESDGD